MISKWKFEKNNGNLEDKEGIQILGENQTFETNYLIEIL
jgi:hypothetical protein